MNLYKYKLEIYKINEIMFSFKKFNIKQDKAAMKVGTDGVLLGAWCSVDKNCDSILDIGAGTGLIALMLAQRSFATTIDAVEIDNTAYEQTVENFENSDWADRLFCYHTDFTSFAKEMAEDNEMYDLIVTNPPFYSEDYETKDSSRNTARFSNALPFNELIKGVTQILSKEGVFSVIIPKKEEDEFVKLANSNSLFLKRVCHVKGNPTSEIKRSLLAFTFTKSEIIKETLIIEKERHQYTEKYIELTKDFYLNM